MRQSTRILSALSVCLHLGLTGIANVEHVDFHLGYGRNAERIASHDCGAHEVHKALATGHQCLLCYRTAGLATFLVTLSVEIPNNSCRFTIHRSPRYSTSAFHTSSLQRAPPIGGRSTFRGRSSCNITAPRPATGSGKIVWRQEMKMLRTAIFLGTLIILNTALGQEGRNPELSQLAIELQIVRAALDSLKNSQSRQTPVGEDAIEALEERLERRLAELENKLAAVARSMSTVVFNPRMTAFINFAARADSRGVMDEEGVAEIDNRPFLRSVEIDFRAPVDPYADAVAILAVEDEAGQGFAVDPEEVYGMIKRVPFLETAPLGLKLKFGKFRAPFGINNRLHLHDLPWSTRPLVVSKFLGTEHGEFFESGFNPIGMDLDFFLPSPIPGATLEANLDVVKSGDLRLSGGSGGRQPAYLGRLNMSADWNNEHLLVVGASAYTERSKTSGRLIGIDGTYKWSPSEQRASRSFVVGGEFFVGEKMVEDSVGEMLTIRPGGWYAYAQAQLSYWLYLGSRFDWVQELTPELTVSRSFSFYASYYTTEFLRFRLGFERRTGSFAGLNTAFFEVNFVFGSHPTEPYWVNR